MEVIKYDKSQGGVFSVPVPKDEFPEYYKQIKNPVDYGTMKTKLENGEFRSAQSMQKDFILILQNCRSFNADTSDIVKEAREQHLMRPKILKAAANKHDLFLAEDGTVLEIFDDEKEDKKGVPKKAAWKGKCEDNKAGLESQEEAIHVPCKKKLKGKKTENEIDDEVDAEDHSSTKKSLRKGKKKQVLFEPEPETEVDDEATEDEPSVVAKPRIRIKLRIDPESDANKNKKGEKKVLKRKQSTEAEGTDDLDNPVLERSRDMGVPKKRRKTEVHDVKSKRTRKGALKGSEEDEESTERMALAEEYRKPESKSLIFLDFAFWKKGRELLEKRFDAARMHLTCRGPWELPEGIHPDKFSEIARATLAKMDRHDRFSVFAEAVKDEEGPDCSEIVKHPMDFGTMNEKVAQGKYGSGSSAAASLFKDFLPVFDNCRLYNSEESEVAEEAARVLSMFSETYAAACKAAAKKE